MDPHRQPGLVARLDRIPLARVQSDAVRQLGFDPATRMAAVVFTSSDVRYGYPNLSDQEVDGLMHVLSTGASIGAFVSDVLKKNHDFEHVRSG